VYGGFWIAANFLRPFRMALAVAIAPAFDRLVGWLQARLKLSKAAAFGTTVANNLTSTQAIYLNHHCGTHHHNKHDHLETPDLIAE
jgi:hypothetical protein